MTDDGTPEISVVAATYRRPRLLGELLESLSRQSVAKERFEVVVVDDGSGDETTDLLAEWAGKGSLALRWESQENAGPATARNRGVALARAPLIAFTDDDCVVSERWLEEYLDFMGAHPEVAGAGGLLRRKHDNLVARWIDNAVRMEHCVRDGRVEILITANACYRKAAIEEAGGFDPRIPWAGGEDPDLSRKVIERGGRLSVVDGALVRHTHRDSLGGVWKDGKLVGMSGQLRKELGIFRPKPLPWAMAGLFYRHCRRGFQSKAPLGEKLAYVMLNSVKTAGLATGRLAVRFRRDRSLSGAALKESLGAGSLKDSKHAK